MAKLNYRRNRLARGLRQQRTNMIGVIVPDVSNPFFTDVVRGIEDSIREAGYLLVLCNSDEHTLKENDYLELLIDQQVAGIILAPVSNDSSSLREVIDAGISLVLIDRALEDCDADTVVLANREGAREITLRLLDRHSTVAHISGPLRSATAIERAEGYRDALEARGVELKRDFNIASDYTEMGGYRAMDQLLSRDPVPESVFVGNNVMTVGVLRRLAELGPGAKAVQIASFDPLPWAVDPAHEVLVLDHPSYQLGEVAASLLQARLRDATVPSQTIVLPSGEVK